MDVSSIPSGVWDGIREGLVQVVQGVIATVKWLLVACG